MATPDKRSLWRGVLLAKGKTIQCVECQDAPFSLPEELHVEARMKESLIFNSNGLKHFMLRPLGTTVRLVHKWMEFAKYLLEHAKVAVVKLEDWELLIPPPDATPVANFSLQVYYRLKPAPVTGHSSFAPRVVDRIQPTSSITEHSGPRVSLESVSRSMGTHVHPSHLETLEQMHAAWAFGAVAELIDNARDAKATRLDILIEDMILDGNATIPVLQVIDNGHGMNHEEIVKMLSFGHKRPQESDSEQIGHFGVGFKTGAMRIGTDAVILTKSKDTCSMGFLSKSYNANLGVLEVPITTYKRFSNGQVALDERVCTRKEEEKCKKAVAKYSPFKNDMSIGAQFAKIENTGTRIFVYNLEQWEGECIFEWKTTKALKSEGPAEKKEPGDIMISSRRVRVRDGQTSKQVPLDYSLRAYAEVLFLIPSMEIYLQGDQVNSRNLTKALANAEAFKYHFIHEKNPKKSKQITLTLGKCQVEYNRGNCGMFLYWHGRLIEAYKRVGAMVHSADIGRGIIGVMDVTDIMDFGNGKVGVLNNKQGFTDSDRFSKLEKWLEETFGSYWDENFDKFGLFKKEDLKQGEELVLAEEWVQCSKCSKWRELPKGWCADDLVGNWFCYMKPFEGNCSIPEDEQDHVVTVAINRDGNKKVAPVSVAHGSDTSMVANTGNFASPESSSNSADVLPLRSSQRRKRLKEIAKTVKDLPKRTKV